MSMYEYMSFFALQVNFDESISNTYMIYLLETPAKVHANI